MVLPVMTADTRRNGVSMKMQGHQCHNRRSRRLYTMAADAEVCVAMVFALWKLSLVNFVFIGGEGKPPRWCLRLKIDFLHAFLLGKYSNAYLLLGLGGGSIHVF
jgi:hypothetical protein